MSDQRPSDVLGGLPRRRPHRRSAKRASAKPTKPARGSTDRPSTPRASTPRARTAPPTALATKQPRATPRRRSQPLRQPAQPPGTPPTPRERRPVQSSGRHIVGTAAQAAAELAEIGLSVGTRAPRNAVGRLPRP